MLKYAIRNIQGEEMANIKSQFKRIEISRKEQADNRSKKTRVATMTKKFRTALAENDIAKAEALLKETIGYIDSARLDGVYHPNCASRKIATLSKELDTAKKAQA